MSQSNLVIFKPRQVSTKAIQQAQQARTVVVMPKALPVQARRAA